jgi:hypothetical protein
MTDKPIELRWPHYEVAPDESLHALGVVSINYARFERTNVWMLAAVANMSEMQAATLTPRVNPADRVKVIETFLSRASLPDHIVARVKHYLAAMRILIENRNLLIHSNMIRGMDNDPAIYSTSRNGDITMFQGSLNLIRRVADDLNAYFYFGLQVANMIATEHLGAPRQAGMMVFHEWPELPPLPPRLRTNE